MAGDGDNKRLLPASTQLELLLLNLLIDEVADERGARAPVHEGHVAVHENYVEHVGRRPLLHEVESLLAVVRLLNIVVEIDIVGAENHFDGFDVEHLIVHDEDARIAGFNLTVYVIDADLVLVGSEVLSRHCVHGARIASEG